MSVTECCLVISDECLCCDACIDVCPNEAILDDSDGDDTYYIVDFLCDCCAEHSGELQCAAVCPVDAIVPCDTEE